MHRIRLFPALPLMLIPILAMVACTQESKTEAAKKSSAATSSAAAATVAVDEPPAPTAPEATKPSANLQVARIVFVGKQGACECTQKRIAGSWDSLQSALGKKGAVPVERLHIDTQAEEVAVYKSMRPILAIPAIYFLDAKGELVEMLQGEVSEQQALDALR